MMTCDSCGAKNPPDTQFCGHCGAYQSWEGNSSPASTIDEGNDDSPTGPSSTAHPNGELRGSEQPDGLSEGEEPDTAVFASGATTPVPVLVRSAVSSPAAVVPSEPRQCPLCRRINDPALRFCAKCGQSLVPEVRGAAKGSSNRDRGWWWRLFDTKNRASRRAYRRSLPLLYRWRRAVIAVLVLAGVGGGLAAIGHNPKSFVMARYYDLRRTLVEVPDVRPSVVPAKATLKRSTPAALTDLTEAAWTMSWQPQAQGDSCGGAPGTGVILLTFAPTRIRQVVVRAGLPPEDSSRLLQARPKSIGVSFDGGVCRRFVLTNGPDRQLLAVDSAVDVTTIRIGVDSAYPSAPDGQASLSITEILLKARPPE
jgi:hypothetical protein